MRFGSERPKLCAALDEEPDRASRVSGGMVMEADRNLDEALKERPRRALGSLPRLLEELVHLEEEPRIEERRRRAQCPFEARNSAQWCATAGAGRAQRVGESLRPPADLGQVGEELGAEANTAAGALEFLRCRQDLLVRDAEPVREPAVIRMASERGQRLDPRSRAWILQGLENPGGETVP